MPSPDAIGEDYIRLAFRIEQHVPGYVDAYFGPAELKEATLAEGRRPASMLVREAQALAERVEGAGYPARRRTYLQKQILGMETLARVLAGEQLPYREEVRRYFDIDPQPIPEEQFEAAIEELETLLPGTGGIRERLAAWKKRFEVSPETARQLIEIIAEESRARTRQLYMLPEAERVAFRLVSDQPWSGYNWYYGDYSSGVDINTDLPIRANTLTSLVCHEAYPGHHTEHSIKERDLWRGRGWAEHAIFLVNTPECVISEGIANTAQSIIFDENELFGWQARELYPVARVEGDPERERRIAQASRRLAGVGGNAALLLHEQGAGAEEVVAYLMRYGLNTEQEARQRLRFITSPLWRAYIFTYFYGEGLIRDWLAGGDRTARFGTLLAEQVYPSLIEQWVIEERRGGCGLKA
ncbi:MAG: hypothetical protein KatS3mg057_2310 [Herpetosiphonaceae bacterium]|nr:MAG: hypothetical protein KatS3mg057_2310 [Herpetosiphonaceae bacterium]